MIRFQDGKPSQVWFSQHSNGQAFKYSALEKSGNRVSRSFSSQRHELIMFQPIAYSGNGSHAVYAVDGPHEHTIPNLNLPIPGLITDHTDAGTLWDPIGNAYFYSYDISSTSFTALDSNSPTGYLSFIGRWGDQEYPKDDPRQSDLFGIESRYASGPTGPRDKNLNRSKVCPNGKDCTVWPFLIARDVQ